MVFSLAELARILSLRAAGKRREALAAFESFDNVPKTLLTILHGMTDLDEEAVRLSVAAVQLDSSYGVGWVCFRRMDMKHVKKPGRLPVIPLLELRDLLREVRDGFVA